MDRPRVQGFFVGSLDGSMVWVVHGVYKGLGLRLQDLGYSRVGVQVCA